MKINFDTSEMDERLKRTIRLVYDLSKAIGELSESLVRAGHSLKTSVEEK